VFVANPRQAVAAVASYMCRGALWGARVTLKLYGDKLHRGEMHSD